MRSGGFLKSKPASRSGAYSAVEDFERRFVKPREGWTLIVGSRIYRDKEDRRKRYAKALGVDMLEGPGVDLVANLEETLVGTFAHIECMSVLEHSRRPWLLAENLERMMEPEGTIFVTVPFCWRWHGYPNDYFRFTVQGVQALFPGVTWLSTGYIHRELIAENEKIPVAKLNGYPYFPRTEAVAFGMKK